jgi:hypothetical protein
MTIVDCFLKKPSLAVLTTQLNDGVSILATFEPNRCRLLEIIIIWSEFAS